ncbi:hypothetical protein KKF34_10445 [Myxococcota bacterium]|nr:hypothetical protein [Myxococcota bacterium]MBU1380514.1 hypothetical protein [Myxococcota bacterium]MBU1497285.1 hypothetical protein [Myxococcota bacterium]
MKLSELKIIQSNQPELLEVYGALGGKKEAENIIRMIPSLTVQVWIESALMGLARNTSDAAFNWLRENIHQHQVSSSVLNDALLLMYLKKPVATAKSILKTSFSWNFMQLVLAVPNPELEPFFREAVILNRVTFDDYMNYIPKVMPLVRNRDQVCKFIFSRIDFSFSAKPGYSIISGLRDSVAFCTENSDFSNKLIAMLGHDSWQLAVLKGLSKRGRYYSPRLFPAIDTLLKEYQGLPGWEKLLLTVAGNLPVKGAMTSVASYVLSSNLWLREEALASLSMAANYEGGRMLHAAARENAGEEAVIYFTPYILNASRNNLPVKYSNSLIKILRSYLRAKNPIYRRSAMYSCAMTSNCGSKWEKAASEYMKELVKQNKYNELSGLISVLSRSSKFDKYIKSFITSTAFPTDVRAAAVMFAPLKIKEIKELVMNPIEEIAVNASWRLTKLSPKPSEIIPLLKSTHTRVKANLSIYLLDKLNSDVVCDYSEKILDLNSLHDSVRRFAFSKLINHCPVKLSVLLKKYPVNMLREYSRYAFLLNNKITPIAMIFRYIDSNHLGIEGGKYIVNYEDGRSYFGYTSIGGSVLIKSSTLNLPEIRWITNRVN